ncbi:MAG: hypothetical protein NXI23_03795 [Bacteroidetes bacterium]|jgi:hypothetical protein|nr:hypothetical protein [Bacteroidota bacterium]
MKSRKHWKTKMVLVAVVVVLMEEEDIVEGIQELEVSLQQAMEVIHLTMQRAQEIQMGFKVVLQIPELMGLSQSYA